jgi:hypothetical protein
MSGHSSFPNILPVCGQTECIRAKKIDQPVFFQSEALIKKLAHGQLIIADPSTSTGRASSAAADRAAPAGFHAGYQRELPFHRTAFTFRAGDLIQFGQTDQFLEFLLAVLANKSVHRHGVILSLLLSIERSSI